MDATSEAQIHGNSLPSVSVVVVNWNGGELLRACVSSVLEHPPACGAELIVVDNDSTDGSLAWLRELSALQTNGRVEVRLIENGANLGFGLANNRAFTVARGEFLLLLNADAEVGPGDVDRMLAAIRSDPRIGAVAPRVIHRNGVLQPNAGRTDDTPLDILLLAGLRIDRWLPTQARRKLPYVATWDHECVRDVPYATATVLMVRTGVVAAVGGFDPRFHMYSEDREWSVRMRQAGWRLRFVPTVSVVHAMHAFSTKRWTPEERFIVGVYHLLLHWSVSYGRTRALANAAAHGAVLSTSLLKRTMLRQPTGFIRTALRMQLGFIRSRGGRIPPLGPMRDALVA